MPFDPFTEWIQLEIYRGNYERADNLLRQYIYQSTRLKTESESSSKQEYYKGMFGGMKHQRSMMGAGSFGMNITKDLPLSKDEYYTLLELLVVYIWLPSKGYDETLIEMNDLPMPQEIRAGLEKRLVDIRNTVVADLKITQAEQFINLSAQKKKGIDKNEESHVSNQV